MKYDAHQQSDITLSLENLQKGDILELLKFVWTASKEKTHLAFKKAGITIGDVSGLVEMANLHATGQDVAGVRMEDGTIVAFDVRKVAEGVLLTKGEVTSALLHATPEELERFDPIKDHR